MNPRSKQALQRYLNKLDKGDPGAQEDGEFDPRLVFIIFVIYYFYYHYHYH